MNAAAHVRGVRLEPFHNFRSRDRSRNPRTPTAPIRWRWPKAGCGDADAPAGCIIHEPPGHPWRFRVVSKMPQRDPVPAPSSMPTSAPSRMLSGLLGRAGRAAGTAESRT